jgi:hypothetical protein
MLRRRDSRALVFRMGQDLGVVCRAEAAWTLWLQGAPAQALTRVHEALVLAQELAHPLSLAFARCVVAYVSQCRRDVPAVYEQAEAAVALATAQGFARWAAYETCIRGRSPYRPRTRRRWPRYTGVSTPFAPLGQRCSSPTCAPLAGRAYGWAWRAAIQAATWS